MDEERRVGAPSPVHLPKDGRPLLLEPSQHDTEPGLGVHSYRAALKLHNTRIIFHNGLTFFDIIDCQSRQIQTLVCKQNVIDCGTVAYVGVPHVGKQNILILTPSPLRANKKELARLHALLIYCINRDYNKCSAERWALSEPTSISDTNTYLHRTDGRRK